MTDSIARVAGTIRTRHRVAIGTKFESYYGVIEGADGRHYVYTASDFLRDASVCRIDGNCTFRPTHTAHATDISTIDLSVG